MLFDLQNSQAITVTLIPPPSHHTTLADVFVGALGVTGVLILASAVLGAVLAAGIFFWNKRHPADLGHLPPVSPFVPDATRPPSPPAR
jgi:hypothetical protein